MYSTHILIMTSGKSYLWNFHLSSTGAVREKIDSSRNLDVPSHPKLGIFLYVINDYITEKLKWVHPKLGVQTNMIPRHMLAIWEIETKSSFRQLFK